MAAFRQVSINLCHIKTQNICQQCIEFCNQHDILQDYLLKSNKTLEALTQILLNIGLNRSNQFKLFDLPLKPLFYDNFVPTLLNDAINEMIDDYQIIINNQIYMQEVKPSLFQNQQILCCNQHQCYNVCVSKGCMKKAFICQTVNCQCQQNHNKQGCYMNSLDYLLNQIQSHKIQIDQQIDLIFQELEKIYNQMIDKLSDQRIKLLDSKQLFGLKQKCTQFVNLIQQGKQSQITGNLCYQVRKQIDEQNHKQRNKREFFSINHVERISKIAQLSFNKAVQALSRFRMDCKSAIDSKILSVYESETIYSYFDFPVSSVELLFRGSQHDFKSKKFHQICDGIPHTIVITKTQHGKIIGGYTPIPWSSNDNSSNYVDSQQKSFLFSVSLNEKYPLIKKKNAVIHQLNNGPVFGGGGGTDLMICDQCNTKKSSAGNFPYCYNNGNYINGTSSYTAFSGSTSSIYFLVAQYEVFRIDF